MVASYTTMFTHRALHTAFHHLLDCIQAGGGSQWNTPWMGSQSITGHHANTHSYIRATLELTVHAKLYTVAWTLIGLGYNNKSDNPQTWNSRKLDTSFSLSDHHSNGGLVLYQLGANRWTLTRDQLSLFSPKRNGWHSHETAKSQISRRLPFA